MILTSVFLLYELSFVNFFAKVLEFFMVDIGYDIWKKAIVGIKCLSKKYSDYYMQLFPFKDNDIFLMENEEYYNKYIRTGCFVMNEENYIIANNYSMKVNGVFRKRYVISPMFYIYYICLGYYVDSKIIRKNINYIDVFYGGDFDSDDLNYVNQYKKFMNDVTNTSYQYEKYIKVDLQNFYSSIDFRILQRQLKNHTTLTDTEIYIISNFLRLIGNNQFPQTEVGITSSLISTKIYLVDFDEKLVEFLSSLNFIDGFKCIRYVDDLFIFFNPLNRNDMYILNTIINYINTILFDYKINLNNSKTKIRDSMHIFEDVKMLSLLEEASLEEVTLDCITKDKLLSFFDSLHKMMIFDGINHEKYYAIVNEHFENENSKYFFSQIYQSFCFKASKTLIDDDIIVKIRNLLDYNYKFLSCDPKTLVSLITNIENGFLIKKILNSSFREYKNGNWDIYNNYIIFQYLLRRSFMHKDLLRILSRTDCDLYRYITKFCTNKWVVTNNSRVTRIFVNNCYKTNSKVSFLYFMYKKEYILDNIIESFAFYKNFFDIMTGHFAHAKQKTKKLSTQYYTSKKAKEFYEAELPKEGEKIEEIIQTACDLRNSNPISHGSAELLNDLSQKKTIDKCINNLQTLIKKEMYVNFKL